VTADRRNGAKHHRTFGKIKIFYPERTVVPGYGDERRGLRASQGIVAVIQ
jgi:hypothetical protein